MQGDGSTVKHDDIGLRRRIVEALCIATAAALWLLHVGRVIVLPPAFSWWSLVLVPVGMTTADFCSGLMHWAADTWGRESMPVIGRRLLHPFRVHHVNPDDLLNRTFLDANGDVAAIMLPILAAMFWLPLDSVGGQSVFTLMLGLTGVGLWTNQVHQWAHMTHPPWPVRRLQGCRLILSRRVHQRHHQSPHVTDYCIATGWCNALLNRMDFFRWLEAAITRATGWTARDDEVRFHLATSGRRPPPVGKEAMP